MNKVSKFRAGEYVFYKKPSGDILIAIIKQIRFTLINTFDYDITLFEVKDSQLINHDTMSDEDRLFKIEKTTLNALIDSYVDKAINNFEKKLEIFKLSTFSLRDKIEGEIC